MIIKRPSILEMPNPQHSKIEDSWYGDGITDEYVYVANPKKRRRDGGNYNQNIMSLDIDDFSSGSGSWVSEDASYWGAELETKPEHFNYKGKATKQSSNKHPPPVMKSSKRKTQLLPSRYDDSVLIVGDTASSFDDEDDDVDIIEENDILEKYNGMHFVRDKFTIGSSNYYGGYIGFDSTEYLVSRRTLMPVHNVNSVPLVGNKQSVPGFSSRSAEILAKEKGKNKKDVYKPDDFAFGDLVWAKCGRTYPAWPAVVIDPVLQAPEAVLRCRILNAKCVMFFGYSKNGTQRDYGCVKQGMIFPFAEFMDRFREPSQLHKSKLSGFRTAVEEAILAENGF